MVSHLNLKKNINYSINSVPLKRMAHFTCQGQGQSNIHCINVDLVSENLNIQLLAQNIMRELALISSGHFWFKVKVHSPGAIAL